MSVYSEILEKYLPEGTISIISDWISNHNIYLRITRNRTSKLGDYYPPVKTGYHKITINHDLNKYAFLITLSHEFAHLLVWKQYKNRVKPHGKEWKQMFSKLMDIFFNMKVFPTDIESALSDYLKNAKASTVSDLHLSRILRKYDSDNSLKLLENIPDKAIFQLRNGKLFRKGEKLRKRYRCLCLDNKKVYLINPLAEVITVK